MEKASVAEVKSHFSRYLAKAAYANQPIIITKRNKPVAAIVDISTFEKIQSANETEGLYSLIDKMSVFNEIAKDVESAYLSRSSEKPRNVSF